MIVKCLFIIVILQLFANQVWALQISRVSHQPAMFDPLKKETAGVNFYLSEAAAIELNIYDDRDILIRKIIYSTAKKGENKILWNGKDESGINVPPEAYRYTLLANNGREKVVHDLSDDTGNHRINIKKIKWNVDKHQFEYQLKKPARVLIRVGLANHGPLMGTIINWLPRLAGQQVESWNGMDASNIINMAKHPKLETTIQAYSLSKNTLFVGPKSVRVKFVENNRWKDKKRIKKHNKKKKVIAAAYLQSPETRGDYSVSLKLPETHGKTALGLPVVKGKVPVVLDVADDEYRQIALSRRAEPVLFIDGQFAMENEVGFLPMTWMLDTTNMSQGMHYLSVNLRGYEGNFGVATMKIHVQK